MTFASRYKKFNYTNNASVELNLLALQHKINFLKLNVAGQSNSTIKIELVELSNSLPLCSDPKITSIIIDV